MASPAHVASSAILLPPLDGHERKIHLRSAGPSDSAAKPTIVIVPGLGSSCLSFTFLQESLAQAGIRSFTYDRPGNGRSSPLPECSGDGHVAGKKPKPRNATQMAAEMNEVLQAAQVLPPYVLMTHSYGGVIAWEYVAAYVENVVGLIFLDANSARSAERSVMGT
ncbi:hypothetical protein BAUCODRAFT_32469 [Baudoinia panamericana UAMH 10762]|uniref:AB hydrolase-1 domain-containing protein n=1 Tax=Baudoinia panamericana (strain UAMH 10762) TaxID=717646 RepID=M2MP03_BAUPA|nr:uncharacterized protein BAUCODRAFT_32469 [Baudoinia panamericana UAMH 10762]EMC98431.1 hypothetical protein BAUCODRAFT_32469 [Baudoinia panamericana UAMH 10762]